MADEIIFSCPLPPRGLRRNKPMVQKRDGSWRAVHWRDQPKLKDEYAEAVWIAGREHDCYTNQIGKVYGLPWERASVHYDWHSTHQTDEDNIIASMKVALDTLTTKGRRPLGIIADDKGAKVSATWIKAARKADEHVTITIRRDVDAVIARDG